VTLTILAGACGDDGAAPAADPTRARAVELARVHGCTSCHGDEGQGGIGPPWQGLAGSEVELTDGRVVTADRDYLRRSITDPQAEQRAGYAVPMPVARLTDDEVEILVDYVESFG
jgi:cytochrome c oxidase subunit II